jgi:hypothetical protein
VDNIVAVLEHSNRVRQIDLRDVSSSDLEKVLTVMQEPFPELNHLLLSSNEETVPVFPNSFLGGSAPRLRHLNFRRIAFPALPKLLLSATHLVTLLLYDIPHSGYLSPEAIVTALSTSINLETVLLKFQSPRSSPNWESRRSPALIGVLTLLPVLTDFWFKGSSEYLDDFVARIDAPRLDYLYITLFNQIEFHTPGFIQFIGCTPRLDALKKASFAFGDGAASVNLSSTTSHYQKLAVRISCKELDWQVSALEQVCTFCLPPLSVLEDLYIFEESFWQSCWKDNIEDTLWLELLRPFTTVKNFYLSETFAQRIVPVLRDLVGASVLPALENIFLEGLGPSGPVQKEIGQFVSTRQATGHPISVSRWGR